MQKYLKKANTVVVTVTALKFFQKLYTKSETNKHASLFLSDLSINLVNQ